MCDELQAEETSVAVSDELLVEGTSVAVSDELLVEGTSVDLSSELQFVGTSVAVSDGLQVEGTSVAVSDELQPEGTSFAERGRGYTEPNYIAAGNRDPSIHMPNFYFQLFLLMGEGHVCFFDQHPPAGLWQALLQLQKLNR